MKDKPYSKRRNIMVMQCCPFCPDHPGLQTLLWDKIWILVLAVPETLPKQEFPDPALEVDDFHCEAKEVEFNLLDQEDWEMARSFAAAAKEHYEKIATYPQRLDALRKRMRK